MMKLEEFLDVYYRSFYQICDEKGKVKEFNQIKSYEERISFMFDLTDGLEFPVKESFKPKSLEKATKLKEEAMFFFEREDYDKALKHLNKAVLFAPSGRGKLGINFFLSI